MYRKPSLQMTIDDFILPFAGSLSADNRWVKLARLIPWEEFEKEYAFLFPSDRGNVAKPVQMALGALIIQARCGYTDRELLEQITENPYLQYFLGLREYQLKRPFTPAALVKFRKRFPAKRLDKITERVIAVEVTQKKKEKAEAASQDQDPKPPTGGSPPENQEEKQEKSAKPVLNQGTLQLDATCTPADVRFPTDLGLLNEAREKLDEIIDLLHQTSPSSGSRPRTYRQRARKEFLSISKQRQPRKNQIRKGIKKQLQYAWRNLRIVETLWTNHPKTKPLSARQEELLATIRQLLNQQAQMYKNQNHRISGRIVSLHQPHVRPIVRGKAGAAVEFGAKVAVSLVDGFARIEKLSWDPFNEGTTLIESVERYRERTGYYPEVLLADKLYRTRENLQYCKEHGIRLSGPKLGRPVANSMIKKAEKQLERQDAAARNAIEGKFGEGKRKYGLGRIMARLKDTAECVIAMQFLVMNLERKLRILFARFFCWLFFASRGNRLAYH